MRPLFRGEGCTINEAGISQAGNPLTRILDGVTNDPLHAQRMRDGMMGPRPMGPMGLEGQMLSPMMREGGDLDRAWAEHGRPPMPMGGPGDSMQEQFLRHMMAQGPEQMDPGFFTSGPMGMQGDQWANQFSGAPQGLLRPPGPVGAMGADWVAQFAPQVAPQMPLGPGLAEMEASFQQAQMEATFKQAQMEAAFREGPQMAPPMDPLEMAARQAGLPANPNVEMEAAFAQAEMEAAFAEAQNPLAQDQTDLAQAAQMVEMLRTSGNPKFANSQFVSFIDKVSKGDLQFKDNTVVNREGQEVDWDSLYDSAAATATDADRQELDQLWQAASGAQSSLENAWAQADGSSLEELWKGAGAEGMEDIWRMAAEEGMQDLQEQAWSLSDPALNMDRVWQNSNTEYQFQKENSYLDSDSPLAEAQRLLREGRDREALLALEAEVQRNPESSEGWRQLGQLYAELDQDIEAIQCLRRGHDVDPYNLDSLLALGVSCTNELDQLPALRYLRMWIENHEEHQRLVETLEPPPEGEYELWRGQVTTLFNQAAMLNPLDADVFVALGVMENINRNYDAAIHALSTACRLRPNDHTVWNKLGATLANSGRSEKAVVAYHQGLQLKPNYARSWSNLAIAHANLGQHADAARFYLSSLVLNPDAAHIWNFLHSAVLNMGNVNAFAAIDQRDLGECTKLIEGVLDPQALPMPRDELPQPPDEILGAIGL